MIIERQLDPATIQHIVETGKVKITLTTEELRQAYLEEKHENLLADAEAQFVDFVHVNFHPVIRWNFTEREFMVKYGFTMGEAKDKSSRHYMLEKFVTAFERGHDCNNADNDAWQSVIADTLEEYSNTLKYRCSYCGCAYIDPEATFCKICGENLPGSEKEQEV